MGLRRVQRRGWRRLNFVPNPKYNGLKPASADAMQWLVRVDNTARVTALQEGTAIAGENILFSNIDQLVGAGVTVDSVDSYGIGFLMFNCQKEPFNDKRVRQAFHYAIDYDKLIKNQLGGNARDADLLPAEGQPGLPRGIHGHKHDPEKAKALLDEAGQRTSRSSCSSSTTGSRICPLRSSRTRRPSA